LTQGPSQVLQIDYGMEQVKIT